MVKTADAVELNPDEQAIVDAFDNSKKSTIVDVVDRASETRPPARVREAYWELVYAGVLIPSASGQLTLND